MVVTSREGLGSETGLMRGNFYITDFFVRLDSCIACAIDNKFIF